MKNLLTAASHWSQLASSPRSSHLLALTLECLVLLGLPALALLHEAPLLYLKTGVWVSSVLLVIALTCSTLLAVVPRLWAETRPLNTGAPHFWDEIACSLKNVFVIGFIAAWPVTNYRLGLEVSLKWSLADTGDSLLAALLKLLLAFVAGDAFFYWQHRLFHTRHFYLFHKLHHSFTNPSPFAIFAVHPVESLSLYFPIWTHSWPWLNQWAPLYVGLFGFLGCFIMYIHSDLELPWLDAVFSRLGLVTAGSHNAHHKYSRINFGGLTVFWDWVCGTGPFQERKQRRGEKASLH